MAALLPCGGLVAVADKPLQLLPVHVVAEDVMLLVR